jgi:hypothetical protein
VLRTCATPNRAASDEQATSGVGAYPAQPETSAARRGQ